MATVSDGWTGYTHQWRKAEYQEYREYVMASCDSSKDASEAIAAEWRYFRVRNAVESLALGEIMCPASEESGHRTTCENCLLCSGMRTAETRKNIAIIVHGINAKNFISLESLAR
jgi:hypothetical protein